MTMNVMFTHARVQDLPKKDKKRLGRKSKRILVGEIITKDLYKEMES